MFVMVRTGSGRKYARRIGQELKRVNPRNNWIIPSVSYFPESFRARPHLNPRNTLIHSRAAYPNGTQWMANLVRMEEEGYRIVNSTDILRLTSDKLACAFKMYNAGLPHPRTWEATRTWDDGMINRLWYDMTSNYDVHRVVVKPYTSMDQGANVKVAENREQMRDAIRAMPTGKVIVQEVINYTGIFRVIVINGRALPMSWVDRPTPQRWRVSVCLNRNMQFVPNPDQELLRVAEQTQAVIGGEVNFIDVFSTPSGRYILSEINTACNLMLHEGMARRAGHPSWNIANAIAKYLDRQARGMHGYY